MGVVAGNPVLEPEDVGHAEIFAEDPRVICFGEARISFLHFAQETFFRRQERAAPIYVDAAAFEHHAPAFVFRPPDAALYLSVCARDDGDVLFFITRCATW